MNNTITNDMTVTYYALKKHGMIGEVKYLDKTMAEIARSHLTESEQTVTEIVPVTASGEQILLG